MYTKKRQGEPRRRPHRGRRLSTAQVARLRQQHHWMLTDGQIASAYAEKLSDLAAEFGVTEQAVFYARHRYTYKELP